MNLLDHLAAADVDTTVTHMLMPSMSIACGLDTLAVLDTGRHVLTSTEVTCPACLDAHGGLDGLRAEISRQQSRQQAVRA